MAATSRIVASAAASLGESPVWDPELKCLHWVDINAGSIHRFTDGAGDRIVCTLEDKVGAIAPRAGGGLVVAAGMGFATVDEHTGAAEWIAQVELGDRMNDGACDPAGRFLAGTMKYDRSPGAALYRLDPDGTVQTLLTDVAISNGLGWSPAGDRMYYVDTPTRRVDVFDYDLATGGISNRRLFVDVDPLPGNPDGLTVDADGGVWIVMCHSGMVRRFRPDGEPDAVVELPARRITSCAFGGPNLDELYVTSGRFAGDPQQLHDDAESGSLIACTTGFTGQPSSAFAG